MENNKLKKGIGNIKNIVMTDAEKIRVFDNILNLSGQNQKPIKSPWSFYSFISTMKENQLVYYILIPLIIILSSGGVVFASADSLPDSILYPIKVKVIEPIEGVLAFSYQAKAKHESSLASKRLVEAETLAKEGKLYPEKEKKLNDLLDNHTKALNKALINVIKTEPKNHVDEIISNFSTNMDGYAEALDTIKNGQKIKNFDPKDINKEDNQISNRARFNAEKIREISTNKNNLDSPKSDFRSRNNNQKEDRKQFKNN